MIYAIVEAVRSIKNAVWIRIKLMTCIVAIKEKDKVWMGADSAASGGHLVHTRADAKVFNL